MTVTMKIKSLSTSRPIRIVNILGFLIATAALNSCGTGPNEKPAPKPTTVNHQHWHRVKASPPTYFPKGVASDHPTGNQSDGMWVETGDAAGTRYFIPNRGVDSRLLVAEALTQVTPEQKKKQNRDEEPGAIGYGARGAIGSAATGLGALLFEVDRAASGQNPNHRGLFDRQERR
jgi:hypothetical protein